MVISSPVISISVKLTWLNLTYIQTDGNVLLQSPLGLESHCKYGLCLMCINIAACQGCWLSALIDSCKESNNLFLFCCFSGTVSTSSCKVSSPWFDSSVHHSRLLTKGSEAVLRSLFYKVSNFYLIIKFN